MTAYRLHSLASIEYQLIRHHTKKRPPDDVGIMDLRLVRLNKHIVCFLDLAAGIKCHHTNCSRLTAAPYPLARSIPINTDYV